MLGIEARDHTIGGEHVEHVQAFERCRDQRIIALVFGLVSTGNVGVARLERDELTEAEFLDTRAAVSAGYGQNRLGLRVDLFVKRTSELTVKRVGATMEMEA